MRALTVLLCLTLALAGCSSGGGEPLTQAQARVVADKAVQELATDLAADGGSIKRIVADLDVEASEFGGGRVQMTLEWGLQGTARIEASVQSGALSFSFKMECGIDRQVIEFGGERMEARPQEDCGDLMQEDMDTDFALSGLDDLEAISVTPNDDGTVTAVYMEEETRLTMTITRGGHVKRILVDSPEGSGTIDIERGERRLIKPAAASEKMPTSASAFCWYTRGSCTAEVNGGDDAPLSEFQVRVLDQDDVRVATMPLAGGSDKGYTVTYQDDGDGRFGDGDTFTVAGPDTDVRVVVWDIWADKDITDVGIPGPWLPIVLLVLLGAALQRRTEKP